MLFAFLFIVRNENIWEMGERSRRFFLSFFIAYLFMKIGEKYDLLILSIKLFLYQFYNNIVINNKIIYVVNPDKN